MRGGGGNNRKFPQGGSVKYSGNPTARGPLTSAQRKLTAAQAGSQSEKDAAMSSVRTELDRHMRGTGMDYNTGMEQRRGGLQGVKPSLRKPVRQSGDHDTIPAGRDLIKLDEGRADCYCKHNYEIEGFGPCLEDGECTFDVYNTEEEHVAYGLCSWVQNAEACDSSESFGPVDWTSFGLAPGVYFANLSRCTTNGMYGCGNPGDWNYDALAENFCGCGM